jgi:phosphomannomutase/phosphoglucomutase
MLTMQKVTYVDPSIFRAYDIRGIVNKTLTPETVYAMGQAIGSQALDKGEDCIAVGRDGRLSGPLLVAALCEGILATGCDVIDLGVVPTPLLYYSTHILKTKSGVMLTGSHNPPEYNGLKIMIGGETLAEDGIQQLYKRICTRDFKEGDGKCTKVEIVERYLTEVVEDAKLGRPLKVVVDCGNGVAGNVAPELFRRMGCEVHEIYCDVDGNFPNHHPDPSQVENLEDLISKVRETGADIGLAFDGDGDRLGVVTAQGEIIWPDRQLMLFAKAVLAEQPGAKIIYDVKCTYHLDKIIRDAGGEPIMWKTGHSLIKSKLAETKAALAGEMSGHVFFNDRWYGFDDALYTGARLLQIIAAQQEDTDALFNTIPNSINTPELKVYVSEDEKFLLMAQLIANANFGAAEVVTIDGMRVNFSEGWGLVRPSNTTPCLVLRFEAQTVEILETIKDVFRESLLAVKPDLVLPF